MLLIIFIKIKKKKLNEKLLTVWETLLTNTKNFPTINEREH